jgi:hypothetical protein
MNTNHNIEFTRTAEKTQRSPECLTWYMNYSDVHLAYHFLPEHNLQWFEINGAKVEQTNLTNRDFLASVCLLKSKEEYLKKGNLTNV